MHAFHIEESAVERLLVRLISVPARRFLRIRRSVSFVVCPETRGDVGKVARGTYQSPILLQWGPSREKVRRGRSQPGSIPLGPSPTDPLHSDSHERLA